MANNFQPSVNNLGRIKVGSTNKIIVRFLGGDIKVDKWNISCDCTTAKWFTDTKELHITVTPKPFPRHLEGQESYQLEPYVDVLYNGDTAERIQIQSVVVR
jgi:hypothetical protein